MVDSFFHGTANGANRFLLGEDVLPEQGPSPGRNFPGRFLPARELFSLWCFPPRRGGCVYL
jgi:hypothetical protein